MRRMRVADALREPPAAPAMAGGRARYACVCLSALCHLACHAEMASCLAVAFWKAIVLGSQWFGGKGVKAVSRARSMQRWMPAVEASDGHHSMVMEMFRKMERICVRVVQNSREGLSRVGT